MNLYYFVEEGWWHHFYLTLVHNEAQKRIFIKASFSLKGLILASFLGSQMKTKRFLTGGFPFKQVLNLASSDFPWSIISFSSAAEAT